MDNYEITNEVYNGLKNKELPKELESLLEYIIKFYESNLIPKEIIVPEFIDQELLSDYLKTKVKKN